MGSAESRGRARILRDSLAVSPKAFSFPPQARQFLLQKTDTPSPDAVLADIGKFSVVIRVDVLQAEGVVEHAAAGDADTAFP